MEPLTVILSIVSIANIIVLSVILVIYGRSYLYTRAQLPLAMITFCGLLILHNVISAEAYFAVHELFSYEIFPYMIGIQATEFFGLLIFLKISFQ